MKEKPIKGLEIEFDNKTYSKILYFSIDNWDKEQKVHFTVQENNETTININCKLSEIKINIK